MPDSETNVASSSRPCEELGHGTEAALRSSEGTSFSISSSTSSAQDENPMALVASTGPGRSRSPPKEDTSPYAPIFHGAERERSPKRVEDKSFGPIRRRSTSRQTLVVQGIPHQRFPLHVRAW